MFQVPNLSRWLNGQGQFSMSAWFKQSGPNCSCVDLVNNGNWSLCGADGDDSFFINARDENVGLALENGTPEITPCNYTVRMFITMTAIYYDVAEI